MPALPQQISGSAGLTISSPGIVAQRVARLRSDALRVRQMTGIVVHDRAPNRMPRRPRLAELRQHFRHVANPRREGVRARGPRRIVGEQLAVFLHRRSAAGGVDDDPVDPGSFRTPRSTGARSARASSSRPACRASAPQHPCCGRRDHVAPFGGQHVDRRGVDLREHEPLHAAGQQADLQPRRADGRRVLGERGAVSDAHVTRGASASSARRRARAARVDQRERPSARHRLAENHQRREHARASVADRARRLNSAARNSRSAHGRS